MGRWLKRILLGAAAAVFLFSCGSLAYKWSLDRRAAKTYEATAARFVSTPPPGAPEQTPAPEAECAPLQVDFDALQAVNGDIVGWLWCGDTEINYPVLRGETNDTYLRRLYDGSYSVGGSIFMEAANRADFGDVNTILYGHYMKDGSMFGGLSRWKEQAYYDEHPALWLLSPAQDYRVEIVAAYYTSAYSDAYLLFDAPGAPLDAYLAAAAARSAIRTKAQAEAGARYLLLSTCADWSDSDGRFVLHGKLVPVESAGGLAKGN